MKGTMPSLLLIFIVLASAAEPQDPARRIEERFIAPCCWRESVAVHRSPEADKIRSEIRQLLESGKTEGQIVDFYVARYGERILREPRGSVSLWLRTVPLLALLAGALFVAGYIIHSRRKRAETTAVATLPPLPDLDDN